METHSFSTLERVEAKEAADPGGGAGDDCHFQYPRTGRSQGSLPVERLVHDQDGLSVPSNGSKPRKRPYSQGGCMQISGAFSTLERVEAKEALRDRFWGFSRC